MLRAHTGREALAGKKSSFSEKSPRMRLRGWDACFGPPLMYEYTQNDLQGLEVINGCVIAC